MHRLTRAIDAKQEKDYPGWGARTKTTGQFARNGGSRYRVSGVFFRVRSGGIIGGLQYVHGG